MIAHDDMFWRGLETTSSGTTNSTCSTSGDVRWFHLPPEPPSASAAAPAGRPVPPPRAAGAALNLPHRARQIVRLDARGFWRLDPCPR